MNSFMFLENSGEADWPRLARDWPLFDRIRLTEKQALDLADAVVSSSYFSSKTLLEPSIPEFTAILEDAAGSARLMICYRRTALSGEGFVPADGSEGEGMRVTPLIDAYVYQETSNCNFVVTFCAHEIFATVEGREIRTCATSQLLAWRNDDPYTDRMFETEENPQTVFRTLKALYMGVQMLSAERPDFVTSERLPALRQQSRRNGKGKKRKQCVRFVRRLRVTDEMIRSLSPPGVSRITCPCWGVAGHWRTCKSGKRVWVRPYRKGRQRTNPEAYVPKEYALPKEEPA